MPDNTLLLSAKAAVDNLFGEHDEEMGYEADPPFALVNRIVNLLNARDATLCLEWANERESLRKALRDALDRLEKISGMAMDGSDLSAIYAEAYPGVVRLALSVMGD